MLDAPGVDVVRESDTEVPYWRFMNEDAIAEINAQGVDLAVIKGDIADVGRRDQFEAAARAFAGFRMPHHAFLGNHDYYGLLDRRDASTATRCSGSRALRAASISAAGGWCCSRRRTRANTMACLPTIACTGSRTTLARDARAAHADAAADAPSPGAAGARRQLPEHDRDQSAALAAALRADRTTPAGEGRADRPHAPQPRAPLPGGGRDTVHRGELHEGLSGRLGALPALRGRQLPAGGAPDGERARARALDALPGHVRGRLPPLRARARSRRAASSRAEATRDAGGPARGQGGAGDGRRLGNRPRHGARLRARRRARARRRHRRAGRRAGRAGDPRGGRHGASSCAPT